MLDCLCYNFITLNFYLMSCVGAGENVNVTVLCVVLDIILLITYARQRVHASVHVLCDGSGSCIYCRPRRRWLRVLLLFIRASCGCTLHHTLHRTVHHTLHRTVHHTLHRTMNHTRHRTVIHASHDASHANKYFYTSLNWQIGLCNTMNLRLRAT